MNYERTIPVLDPGIPIIISICLIDVIIALENFFSTAFELIFLHHYVLS